MERLGTESAFEVLSQARQLEVQGHDIIHLEIGEPDFPTPDHVVEAAIRALRDGWTHYGPTPGLPQLREAIAQYTSSRLGIPVEPKEVVVTPGAKPILCFAMLALIENGDEVLYPDPGFPIYESLINFAGGRPVPYGLKEERGFEADIGRILAQISQRTKLIILNSPHNPTGGVISADAVAALAGILASREIFVLSDEIYSRLVYEGRHISLAQFPGMKERTIIMDGFSKAYAMTGWRLGYGIMPADLAQQMALLMVNSNSCTASFSQIAAVEALRGDQSCVEAMLQEFRRRRRVIVDGLNRIPGFRCPEPHGAFYVFPNITGTGCDSRSLANALLVEAGVACLAGNGFGSAGEGYLRFSFANSVENIQRALHRIEEWARKNF
jgi:aspartate/methionine/tyrosine aminotransferase